MRIFSEYQLLDLVVCSLSSVAGEDRGDPNEDVDCVQVNADAGVDGVEGGSAVAGRRMALSLVNDFLCVVQQEGAKEDQSAVHGNAVQSFE